VTFVHQLCESSLKDDDSNQAELKRKAIKLMLMNSLEALVLPPDVITNIVTMLDKVWDSEHQSVLLQEHTFSDFVSKLIVHEYNNLLAGDQILFKFVTKVFPRVQDHVLSAVLRAEVMELLIMQLSDTVTALSQPLQEDAQHKFVQEFTLLFSVLGIVLKHQPTKNLFEHNYRSKLARIRESLTSGSSCLSSVPETTKTSLAQLVEKALS